MASEITQFAAEPLTRREIEQQRGDHYQHVTALQDTRDRMWNELICGGCRRPWPCRSAGMAATMDLLLTALAPFAAAIEPSGLVRIPHPDMFKRAAEVMARLDS